MPEDHVAPPPPPVAAPPYPSYGQSQPSRRRAWFGIAIIAGCLALVIPVLLIIAAIAIPQLLKCRKQANEASATQTIRTIQSAQATYVAAYPGTGYACSLSDLSGDRASSPPSARAAQLLEPALGSTGDKDGYTFAITCGTKTTFNNQDVYTSYKLTAVPEEVGRTGENGYCSDENNFIRFDPTGGAHCR